MSYSLFFKSNSYESSVALQRIYFVVRNVFKLSPFATGSFNLLQGMLYIKTVSMSFSLYTDLKGIFFTFISKVLGEFWAMPLFPFCCV